jgi:hypothetical protein
LPTAKNGSCRKLTTPAPTGIERQPGGVSRAEERTMRYISYQPNKEEVEVASICNESIFNFIDVEIEEFSTEEEAAVAFAAFIKENPSVIVTGETSREALNLTPS